MNSTALGLGIMAVPVLLALFMLLILASHRRQARAVSAVPAGWVPASGLVVDEITGYVRAASGSLDRNTVFVRQPIVRYRTSHGHDVTFRSGIRASFMPRPGTAVTVYHDPADPQQARIAPESIPRANKVASGFAWGLMAVLFVPFAALFGFIGLIVLGT